ncbi:MAG: hypothetical protein SFU99_01900 [Saprospiraceae bacterium]|nr:hypothetical protein [Saprospiraceae bacterium]
MKFYYSDLRNILRMALVLLSIGFLSYMILPKHYFLPKPACQNTDTILSEEAMESAVYQDRVLEILNESKPEDFRYFFKTFLHENQNTYLIVNLRNADHCFDVKMRISNNEKLKDMQNTKGKGYPEELFGVIWKIQKQSAGADIIFLDMHRIID